MSAFIPDTFSPKDPDFAQRVRDSFQRQTVMGLIGARLVRVEPGEVAIELPFRADLCQQHGFFHAGITSTIADSAAGYAGYSLFPADASVLPVEFKINLLAPADGDLLRAVARVVKPGRTLTITEAEVTVVKGGAEKVCARMSQTLMCLAGRPDMPQAG
ncbi:MAG: PaaI family thioesterase [Kiloniellaceae bacterium]